MNIQILEINGAKIAQIISDEILIHKTQDALDIMGEAGSKDCYKIVIHEKNIISDFFDLKKGIAGDILQKFSTYNVQLAIIGDFSKYRSNSLNDFIFESNKYGRISFVEKMDQALSKLANY
jgi:hypothetical protein